MGQTGRLSTQPCKRHRSVACRQQNIPFSFQPGFRKSVSISHGCTHQSVHHIFHNAGNISPVHRSSQNDNICLFYQLCDFRHVSQIRAGSEEHEAISEGPYKKIPCSVHHWTSCFRLGHGILQHVNCRLFGTDERSSKAGAILNHVRPRHRPGRPTRSNRRRRGDFRRNTARFPRRCGAFSVRRCCGS